MPTKYIYADTNKVWFWIFHVARFLAPLLGWKSYPLSWITYILKFSLPVVKLLTCLILFTEYYVFCVIIYSSVLFTCRINPRPFPAESNPEVSHAEVDSLRGRPHHADGQPFHVRLDLAHDVLLLLGHQHIAQPELVHNLICNLFQTAPQTVKLENNGLPADINWKRESYRVFF